MTETTQFAVTLVIIAILVFCACRKMEKNATGNSFFGTSNYDVVIATKDWYKIMAAETCAIFGIFLTVYAPQLNHDNHGVAGIAALVATLAFCYLKKIWKKFQFNFELTKAKDISSDREFDIFDIFDVPETNDSLEQVDAKNVQWLASGKSIVINNTIKPVVSHTKWCITVKK